MGMCWPLHHNLVTASKGDRVMPSALPRTIVQGAFAVMHRGREQATWVQGRATSGQGPLQRVPATRRRPLRKRGV